MFPDSRASLVGEGVRFFTTSFTIADAFEISPREREDGGRESLSVSGEMRGKRITIANRLDRFWGLKYQTFLSVTGKFNIVSELFSSVPQVYFKRR